MSDANRPSAAPGPAGLVDRVAAALARNDFRAAEDLARQGLIAGHEHPLLLNVAAFGLERDGRLDDAFRLLSRALEIAPGDGLTLASIGHWYSKVGRPGKALEAFDAALAADPQLSTAHHGRGLALTAMRDFEAAEASQRTALRLSPDNADILAALGALRSNAGDFEAARAHAASALRLDPGHAGALVVLGAMDFQAGDAASAADRAEAALGRPDMTGLHASAAHRLKADALDALGDHAGAFAAYDRSNAILRAVHQAVYSRAGVERGPELCARLVTAFSAMAPGTWTSPLPSPSAGGACETHVFLVGFPRSGTTLLEQVLATHDQVVALEEQQTLDDVGPAFFERDTLHRLIEMDGDTAEALAERYWANVARFGVEPQGKVFVDKLPLNSLWLPYIAKVFPNAKILFARRDPRDVVLSCFRRRFLMNGAMYDFTDIGEAARFYAGVMELAAVYKPMIGLDWYDHRHERLVEDFGGETRALCDFLGLPWTERLETFAETARARDVQTPSAPQVRRGLYREGMAQWRLYASGMAPALPILEPWVERLGYPPT